jgi:hypothetical protein
MITEDDIGKRIGVTYNSEGVERKMLDNGINYSKLSAVFGEAKNFSKTVDVVKIAKAFGALPIAE